ncbi:hypothetical protein CS0771_05230 [Catellatospora sp. IY07-71]|nr:hypothetical protein CS0771_05230 [Catellatospora sp. IY07-71]
MGALAGGHLAGGAEHDQLPAHRAPTSEIIVTPGGYRPPLGPNHQVRKGTFYYGFR